MVNKPLMIDQPNLSLAWAHAFLASRRTSGHRLSPLTLSFTGLEGGQITEHSTIRSALDAALLEAGMQKVQSVANTIFPQALWRVAKGDRHEFYKAYLENLPEYVAMESAKNQRGLYFARLIAFDVDHKTGERLPHIPMGKVSNGNQLEFILEHCRPRTRISMLQVSIYDPGRDQTPAAQLGFPCLQHLTFVPDFTDKSLSLNAFYATQQLFVKGYGNYLGLARLGHFVASQTNLTLARVTCFIGVEKMEEIPHEGPSLNALVDACEQVVENVKSAGAQQ
jgi:hypothetical protein